MNEPMKLIEGMKKLKLIEKRIARNITQITQYASSVSVEKPVFGNDTEQKKKVEELVQANKDLTLEYMHLKKRVDMTNLTTVVTIGKDTYTIADLLILRRGLSKLIVQTYQALNTGYGDARLNSIGRNVALQPGEKPPYVVRFYDETRKFESLQECQSRDDEIEQRLEVINATTELVTI